MRIPTLRARLLAPPPAPYAAPHGAPQGAPQGTPLGAPQGPVRTVRPEAVSLVRSLVRSRLRKVVRSALLAPALPAAVLAVLDASATHAQAPVSRLPQWELRADAPLSPATGALLGAGLNVRAGWYARVGLLASAGAVRARDTWQPEQRVDAVVRFQFDPFAQRRRALYGGAGVGVRRDDDGDVVGTLLLVVGVEGAVRGRVVPAAELTLGRGLRLGVALRGRRAEGR